MVLLNIVTCHLLTCFLCYFLHTSFSCNFVDVSSAGQRLCHSWHLGSSFFHLIDFFVATCLSKIQEKCCYLSALVQQGLREVHWRPLKKTSPETAAILYWY